MRIESPFHSGELEAQRMAGEAGIAERNSVVIADTIIGGALSFLAQQQMVVLGSQAGAGEVWASPAFGEPGFVRSVDGHEVILDRRRAWEVSGDTGWQNLKAGSKIGMLAIELATRRRLLINGTILRMSGDELAVWVTESFPNCPKYIQRRTLNLAGDLKPAIGQLGSGGWMTPDVAQVLDTADTLFIATVHSERGLDVSHRGGAPGFIERLDASTIRVPDYPGNSMFNTLGNVLADSRAGIAVMDFAVGRILQMTGTTTIDWHQPDPSGRTGGTGRFWTFKMKTWTLRSMPLTAHWQLVEASPFNPVVR